MNSKASNLLSKISDSKNEQDEPPEVTQLAKDLIDTPSSDSNDDQGQFVQLLKGMAFSKDSNSDEFMKRLMDMVNQKNFGDLTKKSQ